MISRKARGPRDFTVGLISKTSLERTQRATVDLRFGLTATAMRDRLAWFQASASDTK